MDAARPWVTTPARSPAPADPAEWINWFVESADPQRLAEFVAQAVDVAVAGAPAWTQKLTSRRWSSIRRAFDLSREPNRHLSFGTGPHACIGRHIAAPEIKLLFEELLRETSTIEMAGEIGYVRDNFLRGVHSLPGKVS